MHQNGENSVLNLSVSSFTSKFWRKLPTISFIFSFPLNYFLFDIHRWRYCSHNLSYWIIKSIKIFHHHFHFSTDWDYVHFILLYYWSCSIFPLSSNTILFVGGFAPLKFDFGGAWVSKNCAEGTWRFAWGLGSSLYRVSCGELLVDYFLTLVVHGPI